VKELAELVEAAQSGDSEAYDALLQRFEPMAYAMPSPPGIWEIITWLRMSSRRRLLRHLCIFWS